MSNFEDGDVQAENCANSGGPVGIATKPALIDDPWAWYEGLSEAEQQALRELATNGQSPLLSMDDVAEAFFQSLSINPELTLLSLADAADPNGSYRAFIDNTEAPQ